MIYSQIRRASSLCLSGIFPPIPTPFTSKEELNIQKLEENLARWEKIAFQGYLVQGSNGEFPFLTTEERIKMVEETRKNISKEKILLAGSGCESTSQTIKLTEAMAKVGANAVVVITPSFYKGKMTESALIKYYTDVADRSPIPIVLYSVPGNTTIDLSPSAVRVLAVHDNIVGLKDSGGDISKLTQMVAETLHLDFQILAGSASFLLPSYSVGCVGGICALANVLGSEVVQMHSLYHEGKQEEALQLQRRLVVPNAAVTKGFGVPGLKKVLDWFGYYGGPARSPLLPLTAKEEEDLLAIFKKAGYLEKS